MSPQTQKNYGRHTQPTDCTGAQPQLAGDQCAHAPTGVRANGHRRGHSLNIDGENMVPARWAEWIKLPVRDNDYSVRTPSGPIRVPVVIVLSRFAKVPKRRSKFSARAIWARDGGRCQYTGADLRPSEGNIDHVLPRSRGGKTSWENCVLASKDVNSRKADRLPEEVGLRLLKPPTAPKELPSTLFIRNVNGIAAWKHFLVE